MCVKIYALFNPSSSCFSPLLPQSQRAQDEAFASDSLPPQHTRQARSAPVLPSGQLANYNQPQDGADARNNLSKLLAQLLSRKGTVEECLKSPSFSHLITHLPLPDSSFPLFCTRPSLMLCLSPTIWHFPPPSGVASLSSILASALLLVPSPCPSTSPLLGLSGLSSGLLLCQGESLWHCENKSSPPSEFSIKHTEKV